MVATEPSTLSVAALVVSIVALVVSIVLPIFINSTLALRTGRKLRAEQRIETEWEKEAAEFLDRGESILERGTARATSEGENWAPLIRRWFDGDGDLIVRMLVVVDYWQSWLYRSRSVGIGRYRWRMIRHANAASRGLEKVYEAGPGVELGAVLEAGVAIMRVRLDIFRERASWVDLALAMTGPPPVAAVELGDVEAEST